MSQHRFRANLRNLRRRIESKDQSSDKARRSDAENRLINAESELGRTLFGELKPGHQREFFCLQKNVWIWYEDGQVIRYEVRQSGVYKKVNNNNYTKISDDELEHFRAATKAYLQLLKLNLYKA